MLNSCRDDTTPNDIRYSNQCAQCGSSATPVRAKLPQAQRFTSLGDIRDDGLRAMRQPTSADRHSRTPSQRGPADGVMALVADGPNMTLEEFDALIEAAIRLYLVIMNHGIDDFGFMT